MNAEWIDELKRAIEEEEKAVIPDGEFPAVGVSVSVAREIVAMAERVSSLEDTLAVMEEIPGVSEAVEKWKASTERPLHELTDIRELLGEDEATHE